MTQVNTLYSKFDRFLYTAVAITFGAGSVAAVAAGFAPGATNAGPRIAVGAIAAVLAAAFSRIATLRVAILDDYLLVVNPIRTHRIPWADIQRIDTVVLYGWKVRIWRDGKPRLAFGLCQFSEYATSHGPQYDDIHRDAPRWLSRAYNELHKTWTAKRQL